MGERMARCGSCLNERPSSERASLAFFEDRSAGKTDHECTLCGYHDTAHTPEVMARNKALKCTNFTSRKEGREYDLYYCGCRGWD